MAESFVEAFGCLGPKSEASLKMFADVRTRISVLRGIFDFEGDSILFNR